MELTRNARKEIIGRVSSSAMNKSIVVELETKVKHPKYGKYFKKTKLSENRLINFQKIK